MNDFVSLTPKHNPQEKIYIFEIKSIIFSGMVLIILLGMLINKLKIKKAKE